MKPPFPTSEGTRFRENAIDGLSTTPFGMSGYLGMFFPSSADPTDNVSPAVPLGRYRSAQMLTLNS